MTNKEFVLETLKRSGKLIAQSIQNNSESMTGTELNSEKDYIPSFVAACDKMNMLERPIGFVCKSSSGRIVKLLQNYDSTIYASEPEELPAQWGFVWSDNPEHALPFVALATSPYMIGNCCSEDDQIYKSKIDNNVHSPSEYSSGWEIVK